MKNVEEQTLSFLLVKNLKKQGLPFSKLRAVELAIPFY